MKYLLPCKCGQSVEIVVGQAGQMVACSCGENLLVPTMLQVKALPVVPEKPKTTSGKTQVSYRAALVSGIAGVVCLGLGYSFLLFENWLLHTRFYGFAGGLFGISLALACRAWAKSPLTEDSTLRRTFFILGIVLLAPTLYFAIYLYMNPPHPSDVSLKRVEFSFGTNKRMLFQDSTPISWQEHQILWMTDEHIDHMMPMELFFYFRTLKEPTFSYNYIDNYTAIKETYRIQATATAILLFLAMLSIVASFFMPRQQVVVTGWSGSEWQ